VRAVLGVAAHCRLVDGFGANLRGMADSDSTVAQVLAAYFSSTPVPLVCAYLFGSFARGEQTRSSDVDVALLFPAESQLPDARTVLSGAVNAVRGDLERLLRRPVDVVDLRVAPVDLVHRVLRDGQLLVQRDARERVRFEVDKRNEYFDLQPFLNRYRRGQAA
jgi:predicted nucleotidyltransferase